MSNTDGQAPVQQTTITMIKLPISEKQLLDAVWPINNVHPDISLHENDETLIMFEQREDGSFGVPVTYETPTRATTWRERCMASIIPVILLGLILIIPMVPWIQAVCFFVVLTLAATRQVLQYMAEMEKKDEFYRKAYVQQVLTRHLYCGFATQNHQSYTDLFQKTDGLEERAHRIQVRYDALRRAAPDEILAEHDAFFATEAAPDGVPQH